MALKESSFTHNTTKTRGDAKISFLSFSKFPPYPDKSVFKIKLEIYRKFFSSGQTDAPPPLKSVPD